MIRKRKPSILGESEAMKNTIFKMTVVCTMLLGMFDTGLANSIDDSMQLVDLLSPANTSRGLSELQCKTVDNFTGTALMNYGCYISHNAGLVIFDCEQICQSNWSRTRRSLCRHHCPDFIHNPTTTRTQPCTFTINCNAPLDVDVEVARIAISVVAITIAITIGLLILFFRAVLHTRWRIIQCNRHQRLKQNTFNDADDFEPSELKEIEVQPCPDSLGSYAKVQCKEVSRHGRFSIELGGKVYNLETVPIEERISRKRTELSNGLVHLIQSICSDECVSSAKLYQSPSDSKELLLVGVGADKKVEAKLQAAVREHFPDFTIYTDATNHYSEHAKNLSRHAFTAIKESFVEGAKKFVEVQTATCELVLEGESIAANDHTDTRYYTLLPAHFILEQRDMEMLLAEDVHPGATKHVQEGTAGKSINSRYELSTLNPRKSISLRSSDAMFAYRQFYQGARKGPEHFSSFYNDSYLLEIEKGYLYQRKDSIISFEELEEAMRTRQDGKVLDEVLPVRRPAQLANMGMQHVSVEVGPYHGYMIQGITPLQKENDRPQLHHVQFVLKDWPLMEGRCGSIVYVIDADNGHRYPFGMFVGLARIHHIMDLKIYQAIVLSQAIDELEYTFSHKVRNLKPLGSSTTEEKFSNILPHLNTIEDSQCGIGNSVFPDGNCQDLTSVNMGIKAPSDRKYKEDHANQLVKYLDKRGPMEGYHAIPDGIKQFISRVAQEQEVECGAIYQCPLHPKELEIIGMRASSMSDVIKPSMSEFPGYSFAMLESSDPRHHVEFRGNYIFSVSKGVWQSGRDPETSIPSKVLHRADSSHCGLILMGNAVRRNTVNVYYVVVPAHLVLEKELNKTLLEVTNTKTMEEMRKEVQSTTDKTMYTLHMHNSTNTCDIQPIPLFAYRHFIPRDSSEQRFGQFTNDLAILKIETDQTRDEEQTGVIPLSNLFSAMQHKFGIASDEQPTVIDDIFPLQYPDTLIEMARVGVRVLIGSEPIKGHLVPCGDPLTSDGRTWSFAIEFITYSSELKPGDCGLILYVQDTREGKRLYPFGMFIGKSLRKHCCGQTIYRAVVLRQALNEIQSHYDHQVANLRPIGRGDNRETNGADWVPDLCQLGEEEDLKSAACLQATTARSVSGESAGSTGVVGANGLSFIHQASD